MYFLKEYKSVICILLIAIFVFAFSTVVTSATIDDMDSFKDLEENNVAEENEYEDIETKDDEEENNLNDINDEEDDEDESKNDIKSNLQQEEKNNITENTKQENQNTSTNSLSKAGIEDTPGIVIIALFVIASVYAYIKTKKYNNA